MVSEERKEVHLFIRRFLRCFIIDVITDVLRLYKTMYSRIHH